MAPNPKPEEAPKGGMKNVPVRSSKSVHGGPDESTGFEKTSRESGGSGEDFKEVAALRPRLLR